MKRTLSILALLISLASFGQTRDTAVRWSVLRPLLNAKLSTSSAASTARTSISLTTTGSGAASYNNSTGVFNVPTPSIPTNNNTLTNGAGYVTQAGARTSVSLTTTGTGAATYNSTTGVLNVPTPVIPTDNASLANGAAYVTQAGARTAVSLTTTGTTGAPTYNSTTGVLNIPRYDNAQYTKGIINAWTNNATVTASTTQFYGASVVNTTFSSTETARQSITAVGGVARNFYIRVAGTQPSPGDAVVTVRINGVSSGIVVTIPAGTTTGTFSDVTHSVAVAAGDLISYQVANAAASASIGFSSFSLEITNN